MMFADVFRAIMVSGTFFLIGSMLAALRALRNAKEVKPAPAWANNLFAVGAIIMAIGASWNAWVNLGERVLTPGRILTGLGVVILSVASLILTKYFGRDE